MLNFEDFKKYLQLTDDSLEPLFLTYEPVVESDVSEITKKIFNQEFDVSFSKNSTVLNGEYFYNQDLFVGAEIQGTGIPSNTRLYNWDLSTLVIDKYTTQDNSTTITVNPVPVALKLTLAKMVLFQIKTNTETESLKQGLSSKSMSVVSVTYNTDKALDNRWDYPKNLVKMVQRYKRVAIDTGMTRNPYLSITFPDKYRS